MIFHKRLKHMKTVIKSFSPVLTAGAHFQIVFNICTNFQTFPFSSKKKGGAQSCLQNRLTDGQGVSIRAP